MTSEVIESRGGRYYGGVNTAKRGGIVVPDARLTIPL
jgi:hypothetical protein